MNLYEKINEVKKVIDGFKKDATTTGYGAYKYVSGSQILSSIKDKMEELKVLFLPVETKHRDWTTFSYKTNAGKELTDFIVDGEITYEWINAEKPEERQRVIWQYYGQQSDISKAYGSALTYAERYLLLKSLGASTDEDDPDKQTRYDAITPTQRKQSQPKEIEVSAGITEQQVAEIKTALNEERLKKMLDFYKVNAVENLSSKQAMTILKGLEKEKHNGEI